MIDRNLFIRIFFASRGEINKAVQKRLFQKKETINQLAKSMHDLSSFYFAYLTYKFIIKPKTIYGSAKDKSLYAKIYIMRGLFKPSNETDFLNSIEKNYQKFSELWSSFVTQKEENSQEYQKSRIDKETSQVTKSFNKYWWFKSNEFERDVKDFVIAQKELIE